VSPARFALIAALDNWVWLAGFIKWHERIQFLARQGVPDYKAALAGLLDDPRLSRLLEPFVPECSVSGSPRWRFRRPPARTQGQGESGLCPGA
jgi:hypothetical protein